MTEELKAELDEYEDVYAVRRRAEHVTSNPALSCPMLRHEPARFPCSIWMT